MKIQFLGATGTVTGSKYLVKSGTSQILIDCGLFQGLKALRLRNWDKLPVAPESLDGIVLTHAHIDHSGYLPVVVREGFKGRIYGTHATCDLCNILLPDAGWLQEEDARYANKKGFSKHEKAKPLYTKADANKVLKHLHPTKFNKDLEIGRFTVRFIPAGHILGAASVQITADGHSVLFSGDLGRSHDLLIHPPEVAPEVDWIVMESTYGDRLQDDTPPTEALASVVREVAGRDGILVIPSFAVGRAQAILYSLHQSALNGDIPKVPVYLNSPMSKDVTLLYQRHTERHKLSSEECASLCNWVRFVNSAEESKALNSKRGPMVIVSASGMATGGRVLHHLTHFGPDPKNGILFPGFQAQGTRGALIAQGAKEVKIHGMYVPIRAKVYQIRGFSAHADQQELLDWAGGHGTKPRQTVLTHGEPAASDALRRRLEETLRVPVQIPGHNDQIKVV
jgi:metallo-beta-lactamase family protein